jgi:O-antigen ligase
VSKLHFKNKIKEILTSGYWLIASLTGAFFSFFALNRGGVVVFIEAGFFFVLLNLVTGQYKLKQIPTIHWVTLAICLYLIIFGNLFASHEVKTKYVMYPVRMLFIVFTVHCLSLKKIDSRVYEMLPIVWCLSIFWQFVAVKFFNMPFGTYGNPHYLSNFIISILPLIVYSFWVTNGWYKWLFILSGLLAFDILLRTGSRTAFLAISFSVVFSLIFFIKSRTKWIGLLLVALSFAIIYFSNYGGVADRVKDLLVNLATEERVYFWKSASEMLQKNNLIDWIFGNGIGGYRAIYADYSAAPELKRYFFPHLHPLGILYDNGIFGLFSVFGGLAAIFVLTIKALRNLPGKNISILLKCLLVIFLCWMIHSNLTFPFYSKYAQYPFGFILGTMLVLIDQSNLATKNRTTPTKD